MKDIVFESLNEKERAVKCRCSQCGVVADGLVERMDAQGEWPDASNVTRFLGAIGWLVQDGRALCGQRCKAIASLAKPEPVKPVIRMGATADQARIRSAR